ncbi:Replication factor A protein 3 [Colletotrichum tanaceti]|nr:Replication factor A protein 3 [Colletotrichum tanaceti]
MAEPTSTPRITAQYLDSYVGRNVMLVGKVLQLRGDSAVLDADGNVTAILNRDVHLTNGNAAQIIGKVNPDLSIKVLSSRDLGPDVDFQLAAAVVEATHHHKSLFPSGRAKKRNSRSPSPRHISSICNPAGSDDNRRKRHFPAGAITDNHRSASRTSKPHPLPAIRTYRLTLSGVIFASKDHTSPRTAKQAIRAAPVAHSNPNPVAPGRIFLGNPPYICPPATRSPMTPRKPPTGSGTRVREEMAAITSKDQDHWDQRYKSRALSTTWNCRAPSWTASDA